MKQALLLFLFATATQLGATTILIDFGTVATTGGPTTWNNFTDTANNTSYALSDTTGASTGYSITLTGGGLNVSTISDNTVAAANIYAPFTPNTVIQDFQYQSGARTFTLAGLQPGVAYDITFYAYADRDTRRTTSFTIPNYTTLILEPTGNPAVLDSGGETGSISGILPDSSATIPITVVAATGNAGSNWILSGMSITYTIPEPSGVLLSALGVLPLLRRRRAHAGQG
jgi:hypothetical protein